jgi:signal peptidase I
MLTPTPKVVLSDDVKETWSAAKRLTRQTPNDLDLALALVRNNRLYSKLDTLLKAAGIAPKALEKALVAARTALWRPGFEPAHVDSSALELAKEIAENDARSLHQGTARVQVEHLLRALSRSAVVKPIFDSFNLDETRMDQAVLHTQGKAMSRGLLFFLKEVAEVVVVVLFFLVAIREGIGEPRLIPSESMVPTLQIDDRVIIEKMTRWWRPYQRGDVLVFYPPMTVLRQDPISLFLRATGFSNFIFKREDNIDVAYIKRLIGMPGDTLEVKPGVGVFINGKLLKEPYVNELAMTCTQVIPEETCAPVKVPEGHYYFMGDNRNQSQDSRYWGFEPADRIVGRAVFKVWPLPRFGAVE